MTVGYSQNSFRIIIPALMLALAAGPVLAQEGGASAQPPAEKKTDKNAGGATGGEKDKSGGKKKKKKDKKAAKKADDSGESATGGGKGKPADKGDSGAEPKGAGKPADANAKPGDKSGEMKTGDAKPGESKLSTPGGASAPKVSLPVRPADPSSDKTGTGAPQVERVQPGRLTPLSGGAPSGDSTVKAPGGETDKSKSPELPGNDPMKPEIQPEVKSGSGGSAPLVKKPTSGSRPQGPITTVDDPPLPSGGDAVSKSSTQSRPAPPADPEEPGVGEKAPVLKGENHVPQVGPDGETGARTPIAPGSRPGAARYDPGRDRVDAADRTYGVISVQGTYEDLLIEFGRQSGLTPTGDIPKGNAYYAAPADKEMTWEEAFRRVKTAIWQADVLNRRTIVRDGEYLVVLSVNDYWRQMPEEHMFTSVAEFRAARPHDDELVYVQYELPAGSAANLDLLRSFVPDYARIAPVQEGSNVIGIYAKVSDINKYLTMAERFLIDIKDRREFQRIACQHILPSQAVETIERFMQKPGGKSAPRTPTPPARPTGGAANAPSRSGGDGLSIAVGDEPESIFIPNDERKEVQAYALPIRIEEFRRFLSDLDVEADESKRVPVVIPVEHADADDLAQTIESILDAESGKAAEPAPPRPTPGRPSQTRSSAASSHGVVILPMTDWNQLVVVGSEEGVARVKELAAMFDQPTPGDATLHIAEIRHKTPSWIVALLQTYDSSEGAAAPRPTGGNPPRGGARPSAGKFTPDDENGRLYVLCSDREWERYAALIEQLDVDDGANSFTRIALSHLDPNEAIERINSFLGGAPTGPQRGNNASPSGSSRKLLATDGGILVFGAGAAELQQIRDLVGVLDQPSDQIERTFTLQYADPQTIISIVEAMVLQGSSGAMNMGGEGPQRSSRPTGRPVAQASTGATLFPLDKRLLVKASAVVMTKIEEVVHQFDVPPEEGTETRVYTYPTGTDVTAMAEQLGQVMPSLIGSESTGPSSSRGGRPPVPGGSRATGPQFIPQAATSKLIVIADRAHFPKIEEMLEHLKGEEASVRAMRHVALKKAQPEQIAAAISAMIRNEQGGSGGGGPRPGRGGGSPQGGAGQFYIAEAPGGHAVVMHGTIAELDQAQKWIEDLDKQALVGQQVKLYHINEAEPKQLVDLIINVIDAPQASGAQSRGGRAQAPAPQPKSSSKKSEEDSLDALFGPSSEPEWESTRTYQGRDLYLQADYYARTILIVTSAAKLEEIDSLLAKLDPAPGEGDSPLTKPLEPYTLIYELSYADAWDAYLALDTYVTGMWEDDPAISYDEDLNTLTVKHPRLSVLQEIQKIVFAVVDKPGEKDVPTRRVIPVPINVPVESVAERINIDGREITKKLAPQANQDVLDDYGVEKVQPRRSGGTNGAGDASSTSETGKTGGGCVLPSSLSAGRSATLILTAFAQETPPESGGKKNKKKKEAESAESAPKEKAAKKSDSRAEKKDDRRSRGEDDGAAESVEDAATVEAGGMTAEEPPTDIRGGDVPVVTGDDPLPGMPAPQEPASPPPSVEPEGESRILFVPRQTGVDRETGEGELEKVSLIWDPITNTLVVEGSYEDVTAVEEMVAELAKEQPSTKPDIRVYRVKYIDPVLAKDIIEEMFGAGSRNMQNLMRQQQQQMQQMAQRQAQQAAAARAAAAGGGGNRSGRGEEEDAGRTAPGLPGGVPGRSGQPGQGDEGQQQNPNQQMLAQMQAQQSTQITVYANPRDRTLVFRAPTGMYPAILELLATIDRPQEVESEFRIFALKKLQAEDVEKKLRDFLRLDEKPKSQEERLRDAESDGGVMPKPIIDPVSGTEIIPAQIRISSNPMANTIIALAPEPALNFIGTLITDWESFELPERKVEWVPLINSLATDVSDMLDRHFADAASGASGGDARGGKASGQSPIAPPTFLPYPRLNVVVVRATEEQMTEVKEVIARLDVAPEGTQYEFIKLHCAEGGELATQLGQMFSDAGSGGKGRGGAPAEGAKFYATGDGRILFYSVPNAIKPEVLATIERIDQQTCMQQEVRIIDVKFGVPSEIAEAVNLAYGGGSRGSSPRGGGRGGSTAAGRITVAASDATRKLFVSAPNEEAFKQVESLVGKLDIVTDLQFRVFKLQYLNARAVLEMMKGMMAQYQSGSGSRGSSEKFAVDADDATNALIVLGGPQTHAFIQMALTDLDTPDKAVGKVVTAMYQLVRANAEEVAKNINTTYGDRKDKGVEIKAEANKAMNVVIVRASEKMQEEIKNNFINPLEEMQPPQLQYKVIDLKHVHPDLMADKIRALISERVEAFKAVGAKGDAMSTTVVISSDPDMRQLLVLADEDNLKFIEERVTMLDTEETSLKEGLLTKKYPVQWADPNVLKSVIDEWTATRTGKGKTAKQTTVQTSARDLVLAFVDPATSSLIVTASENNHERIQQLLAELDVDTGLGAQREVIFLKQANAEELAQVITQGLGKSGAVQKRQPGQQLTVTPVPALNAILISGAPKDIEEAKALVSQLDLPANADAGIVIRVYPLEYLDPQYVVTMVNQAFAQTRSGKQRPEDTIKAAWTPPSNLIIGASKENHDKIAMLLTQLDVASSAQRTVQTIKLTYANAQDVAQNLSQLIQNTQAKKKTEVQPMYVSPDLGTNSLIVFANEVEMSWVKELLTKLDVEEVTTGRTITSIKLSYADPQAVSQAISNVFGQGGQSSGGRKNPQDTVIAFPEMGSRSVIIASSPRMLKDVQTLVAQLDKEEGADRPIRVVEIKNVDPEGVQSVLQDLFSGGADPFGGGRGRRGGGFFFWDQTDSGGGMVVALVPGTNNLVIRANDEEFKKISEIIEKIDVDLAKKQDIRVFMLKHIAVDEAQTALQSYLQRPGSSSGSSNRNPFFFSPSRGGSSEALLGGARISALTSANALVVVAEAEVMETIAGVVAQLDSELYQEGTFEIIGVEQGYNVSLLAQQVSDAINKGIQGSGQGRGGGTSRGSVTITPDARTRSLIVTGAPSLFPQVREMVAQLTSRGPAGGEETRLIPIKRLSADDVQAIIDMLRQQDEGTSSSSGSGRRR